MGAIVGVAALSAMSFMFVTICHVLKVLFGMLEPKVARISNELVSSAHALVCGLCGIVVVCSTKHDLINAQHWLVNFYLWIWAAYGLYDTVCLYYVHALTKGGGILPFLLGSNRTYIMHHIGFLMVAIPLWLQYTGGKGHFFCGCLMVDSLTNPFTNCRPVLANLDMKQSTMYSINYISMTVGFFVFKILLIPFMIHVYGCNEHLSFINAYLNLPLHCEIGTLCLYALYTYWFYKMLPGCFMHLSKLTGRLKPE